MTSFRTKQLPLAMIPLAMCFAVSPATAQQGAPSYGIGRPGLAPYREDAASALARHVRTLAASPRSLSSLLGAGSAALELGDSQAALTFFARAEEVAPRDGQVKAGMGSAFVLSEQAEAALRFFSEAAVLGVPPQSFAKDRGLAYDMLGDQARAQADYGLALSGGSDAETERRMALSKAISGDREGALAVLEPQVKRHESAGWRARAFVLALSGDTAGALDAAKAVMPAAQAGAMQPFLARLPQLSAIDRVMAVHFGRFPHSGSAATVATGYASAATASGRPDAGQPALGTPIIYPQPQSQRGEPQPPISAPVRGIAHADLLPSEAAADRPEPAAQRSGIDFADVVADIAAMEPNQALAEMERPVELAEVKAAPKPVSKKTEPAKPREPSRIWVQIAAAQDKGAFPGEYKRIKARAPKLLAGTSAWTTPLRSTNRLLVGPFETDKEARDLVNELSKLKISSYAWTSEAGQAIEKLPAR
jgi:Flp pilus assembly protein TadD